MIYLCPKYVDENTPEPYRTWLIAIDDTLDSHAKGRAGAQKSMVQAILNAGIPMANIAEISGLSEADILKLKGDSSK